VPKGHLRKDFAAMRPARSPPLFLVLFSAGSFELVPFVKKVILHTELQPEAKFLEEILTKVLRVYLLAIHSHLYSFALRFNSSNLSQFLQFSYRTL